MIKILECFYFFQGLGGFLYVRSCAEWGGFAPMSVHRLRGMPSWGSWLFFHHSCQMYETIGNLNDIKMVVVYGVAAYASIVCSQCASMVRTLM